MNYNKNSIIQSIKFGIGFYIGYEIARFFDEVLGEFGLKLLKNNGEK